MVTCWRGECRFGCAYPGNGQCEAEATRQLEELDTAPHRTDTRSAAPPRQGRMSGVATVEDPAGGHRPPGDRKLYVSHARAHYLLTGRMS